MKQITCLVGLSFTLSFGCGDNLEGPTESDSESLRVVCDQSADCDAVVDDSLSAWLESASSTYGYSVRFTSETGLRIDTEVDVVDGAPIARRASGVRPDEGTGALVPFEWSEALGSLGSHSEGARPVPIPTLYEECILDVLPLSRVANEIVIERFETGELKSCTYRPRDCTGDCTFGPSIRAINTAAE